jgi:hypothetical protein
VYAQDPSSATKRVLASQEAGHLLQSQKALIRPALHDQQQVLILPLSAHLLCKNLKLNVLKNYLKLNKLIIFLTHLSKQCIFVIMSNNILEKRIQFRLSYAKVSEWAEEHGYQVVEGPDEEDACWSDVKQITIYSGQGVENRLYSLLHECGHALIRSNAKNFEHSYPAHATAELDGRKRRSDKYKVSLIEEEVEAWKRGYRLAKRLGVFIDENNFNKLKTKCLISYFNWAVEP